MKFFDNLSDEKKKGFAGIVALRAFSGYSDRDRELCEYHIQAANEANKNFWDKFMQKNPDIQYRTLAMLGIGNPVRHVWINGPKTKKKSNMVMDVVRKRYPSAKLDDILFFIDINETKDLI